MALCHQPTYKTKKEMTKRKFTLLHTPCQSFFWLLKYEIQIYLSTWKSWLARDREGLFYNLFYNLRTLFYVPYFITYGLVELFSRNFGSIHHDANYEKYDSKACAYALKDSQDCWSEFIVGIWNAMKINA